MSFFIDNQSLHDLGIFGRGGIFELFNAARTRGGAAALEEMFRYPLSDAVSINRRSAILRHIAERGVEFPFRGAVFDTLEHYLSLTDPRTRLAPEDNTLERRLKGAVGGDSHFSTVQSGVQAVQEMLAGVGRLTSQSTCGALGEELAQLFEMAADPLLEPLRQSGKLNYERIAALDNIARFEVREKLLKLLQRIYLLDAWSSAAETGVRRGFAFARAVEGVSTMKIEGMFHPLVEGAVSNSLTVTPEGNVLLLTGANMAGKSTLMKTLALMVYLAHVGFPVPAAAMEFGVLDGIYTTINLPDDIAAGYSHFYAEVVRVKKVAQALGKGRRLLVIFDELFRGTNVKDAHDATLAITEAFAQHRECLFVISTHIIEVGDELRKCPNVRFIYMPTVMEGNTARYPYKLAEGITADRHGMMIIGNENILDIIKNGSRTNSFDDFVIDKQTLDDLNVLGEFRPGSLFSLFNRTRTRGGKRLLEEIFRTPLTNAAAIEARSAEIEQMRGLTFPLSAEEFAAAESYLCGDSGGIAGTARLKMMQLVGGDKAFETLVDGIRAMAVVVSRLRGFAREHGGLMPDLAIFDERLTWVDSPGEMNWGTVAVRDKIFRGTLRQQIDRMMSAAHRLDMLTAVAEVAVERGFVRAEMTGTEIDLEEFWHPALPNAVANTLKIDRDRNVVFLTGANMAGKSTLMKAFAAAVYLAHVGLPVAARRMRCAVQEGLFTSINVSDNLEAGYSHFYAEVVRVKHVAQQVAAGRNLVIVFDELFKGTNVKDAHDATVAVTAAIGEHRNCSLVVSTHIIEAAADLSGANLQFIYMPTLMVDGRPTYPYRLRAGITDDRQGMIIIRNERIIEEIAGS